MQFRPLAKRDLPALAQMYTYYALHTVYTYYCYPASASYMGELFKGRGHLCAVAAEEDCAVGYVHIAPSFSFSRKRCTVAVYLQPEDSASCILRRAIQYINAHYMQNLDLHTMLQMTAMSKSLFSAGFKEMTGKSFVSYLKYLRVEHAKKLLLETKYPIQDIALQIGYDDERYFRKIFIEITGISPAQFRKGKENIHTG